MPIHTTDAIVLRKQDIRETSLLVTFYTRDFGKIRGLIKGIRGPRGPLGFQAQLFTLNRIVFYDSRKSGVHTVSQCDLQDYFGSIREDIANTSYACYFLELTDAITGENDKNEEVFDILLKSLELLNAGSGGKRVSRILEIKLLRLSGLMPRISDDELFGRKIMRGTANFIEHVGRAPYEKLERIKVSRDVGEELEGIMRSVLDYHLEVRMKTLDFLDKIEVGDKNVKQEPITAKG